MSVYLVYHEELEKKAGASSSETSPVVWSVAAITDIENKYLLSLI